MTYLQLNEMGIPHRGGIFWDCWPNWALLSRVIYISRSHLDAGFQRECEDTGRSSSRSVYFSNIAKHLCNENGKKLVFLWHEIKFFWLLRSPSYPVSSFQTSRFPAGPRQRLLFTLDQCSKGEENLKEIKDILKRIKIYWVLGLFSILIKNFLRSCHITVEEGKGPRNCKIEAEGNTESQEHLCYCWDPTRSPPRSQQHNKVH